MDEPNIYDSRFNEERRVIEESDKEMMEQTVQSDPDKAAMNRCRRRAQRRATCGCKQRSRTRRRKRRILSSNPFLIFYLEMYFKMPGKHVTEVARQAGKEWCALPEEERMKYVRLAEREKRRRRRTGRRRRRRC